MNKHTLTCYEVAWSIHNSGLHITNISTVLGVYRSTIYRWFKFIKLKAIQKFLRDKKTTKYRRLQPKSQNT